VTAAVHGARQTVYCSITADEATASRQMTFSITGTTTKYGAERWEFAPQNSDANDPKAVKVTRWVTAANGSWYALWQGYHFLGNARIMYRDRLSCGWSAA